MQVRQSCEQVHHCKRVLNTLAKFEAEPSQKAQTLLGGGAPRTLQWYAVASVASSGVMQWPSDALTVSMAWKAASNTDRSGPARPGSGTFCCVAIQELLFKIELQVMREIIDAGQEHV